MKNDPAGDPRISRRGALRRAAIIGTGVWAVPTISSIRLPAGAQVGSPAPEPTPTGTEPEPSPTATEPEPSPTATETTRPKTTPTNPVEVGGVKLEDDAEVGGAGLAKTGSEIAAQTAIGAGLTALGIGLRRIANGPSAKEEKSSPSGEPDALQA